MRGKEAAGINILAFSGSAVHTMDTKGRVFLPTAYRDALGEKFVLSLNNDLRALALYPTAEWEVMCKALLRIPPADRIGRQYMRYVIGYTFEDYALDGQGRLMIPQTLRNLFDLKDSTDIRFIGVGECLELWAADSYHGLEMTENKRADEMLDYVYNRYFRPSAND